LQLTIIGAYIFAIGVGIIVSTNIKRKMSQPLWDNEQVRYTRRRPLPSLPHTLNLQFPQYPSYVFSLQYPSLIKGEISSTAGPYTFYICEYFGPHISPEKLSMPKIYYKKEMPQGTFELELPRGNYCIYFLGKRVLNSDEEIEAKFSLTECHDIKPHERWFGLGQTLLEVGIPLLITGMVIY